MGVGVWAEMIAALKTPEALLQDLYRMELQRIALNMQMSVVRSMAKQATECAEKMDQAETTYHDRLQQLSNTSRNQQPQGATS